MSLIERSNPLNLQYRVCVVTSASTPLGVVICKTLLKANALVLGIDSRPRDHELNANEGTHFQFEECSVNDEGAPERIVEAAKKKFGVERLDALVNVVEEGKEEDLEGLKRLTEVIGKRLGKEGKASIVNVLGNVEGVEESKSKPAIDLTKNMASQYQPPGIRCNIIVPESTANGEDRESSKAYKDAQTNMTTMMKTQNINKSEQKTPAKFFEVGNVTLFLAGDMSEKVSGAIVRLDGSYAPLQ